MLTVTVRFYITAGGLIAIIGILLRIAWTLGRFRQEFSDHVASDAQTFTKIDADIRELRQKRR